MQFLTHSMRLPSANLQYGYLLCSYKSWSSSLSYISNATPVTLCRGWQIDRAASIYVNMC